MSRIRIVMRSPAVAVSALSLCAALPFLLTGCGADRLEYTEVKRISEKVTETELQQFLRIIDSLPEKKLPQIPQVLAPLPSWNPSRTLPVKELVKEEQELLNQRWSVDAIAEHLKKNRTLQRAVRREKLTLKQFLGIALTLGIALSRNTLRENQNLEKIIARGDRDVRQLQQDDRSFFKLRRAGKFSILRRAGWITRMDRVRRLREVPPENLALVQRHLGKLKTVFPSYFLENPLDAVVDRLEKRGIPFEEQKSSGFDADITWDRDNAKIGTDQPDP